MNKRVIWQARTSVFLYFYQYLFLIALTVVLDGFRGPGAVFPALIAAGFMLNAKSMKHELTEDSVYLSTGILKTETTIVRLKDIVGFYVIDAPPWSYLSLGTVLLVTNYDDEMHPCIKSIRNPHELEAMIEQYAIKQGAVFQDPPD